MSHLHTLLLTILYYFFTNVCKILKEKNSLLYIKIVILYQILILNRYKKMTKFYDGPLLDCLQMLEVNIEKDLTLEKAFKKRPRTPIVYFVVETVRMHNKLYTMLKNQKSVMDFNVCLCRHYEELQNIYTLNGLREDIAKEYVMHDIRNICENLNVY